jgi:hypothetical protein
MLMVDQEQHTSYPPRYPNDQSQPGPIDTHLISHHGQSVLMPEIVVNPLKNPCLTVLPSDSDVDGIIKRNKKLAKNYGTHKQN